jgi:hypothetical protein
MATNVLPLMVYIFWKVSLSEVQIDQRELDKTVSLNKCRIHS